MLPSYQPGAVVAVRRRLPRPGEVAVAKLNGREVLKRVEKHNARGYFLVGDNRLESSDSREFGPVQPDGIKGTVVGHLPGPQPVAVEWQSVRARAMILYAVLLIVMATTQLASFEEFTATMRAEFSMNSGLQLAGIIVTLEVLALPYLLMMPLSRLFRWLSQVLAMVVAPLWLIMALVATQEVALFGGFPIISLGWGYIAFSVLMALTALLAVLPKFTFRK